MVYSKGLCLRFYVGKWIKLGWLEKIGQVNFCGERPELSYPEMI
jgi:hypothetical protein